ADNIFKYIFGDVGVENAVNNGYESIPNRSIDINGYKVDIENIYMDNLRITFDVNVKVDKEMQYDEAHNEVEQYSININYDSLDESRIQYSSTVEYKGYDKKNKICKSSVQLIGKSDGELSGLKDDKVKINIELVRYYNIKNGVEWQSKEEILGESQINFDMPKDLKANELVEINKTINEDRFNLDIEKLEISPTMMYLDTKGKLDKTLPIEGLYDFKITSSNNNVYKDNMTLSATKNESGSTRQTIVPSIYYDESENYELEAKGLLVDVKKDIKLEKNQIYPLTIDFFDSKLTIKDVFYKDGKLTVEVIRNSDIAFAGSCSIEGSNVIEQYLSGDTEGFVFDVSEKDEYDFTLEMIVKYNYPISVNIKR
ncbi:MAG: hypothetical protein ACRC92_22590, partial [Peptostreptococcaceae bacterium]